MATSCICTPDRPQPTLQVGKSWQAGGRQMPTSSPVCADQAAIPSRWRSWRVQAHRDGEPIGYEVKQDLDSIKEPQGSHASS